MGQRGSRSEFARAEGYAPSYVTKLGQQGRLVLVKGDDGRELVDFELTRRLIRNTADLGRANNGRNLKGEAPAAPPDAAAANPPQPPTAGSRHDVIFRQAQTQERVYEAKMAELRYQREAGKLIDRDSVERAVADAFRKLQERAFTVPRSASHKLSGITEPREIERVLDAELRKAFGEWDDRLRGEMQQRIAAA